MDVVDNQDIIMVEGIVMVEDIIMEGDIMDHVVTVETIEEELEDMRFNN